jgi:hypothetical protein
MGILLSDKVLAQRQVIALQCVAESRRRAAAWGRGRAHMRRGGGVWVTKGCHTHTCQRGPLYLGPAQTRSEIASTLIVRR